MLKNFPRYPLMFGATPIEKLSRLSAHLGNTIEIFAKRDDCNSGLAYGGNKIRKLEYIVPDILSSDADTLVTVGGIQSNHTRQVAAVAAKLGMKCRLIQENWVPNDYPNYDQGGNLLLSRLMGANIECVDDGFNIDTRASWQRAIEDVKANGGKPYAIPAGASMHPLGGLGYVGFADEVVAQERTLGFEFDAVVVCAVTGSTLAGMWAGFSQYGRGQQVIGIDASCTLEQTRAQVLQIAHSTATLIDMKNTLNDAELTLHGDFAGPKYGIPSDGTHRAILLCAQLEGMITDPVYEGKSMQGLIALIEQGQFSKGSKVLYCHLGGAPAIDAYSHLYPHTQ